jgi:cell division protein FtsB
MREFKKRRSNRQEVLHTGVRILGVFLLLLLSIFAVHAAWNMFGKFKEASRGQEEAKAELDNLQVQKEKLSSSLARITTPEGQETELRARFGVARPGEGEIDIVRDPATTSTPMPQQESWWLRVFHAVFVW